MISSYDPGLVVLSILISVFASFTALQLAQRMRESDGGACYGWLTAAAVAMGGGIWAMHFVAMLAFSLSVPITYDVELTIVSLLLAIGFTAGGICITFHFGARLRTLLLAGLFMGTGVASMHYTGMAAMRMPALVSYDDRLVILSVLIAIVASTAALWLTFRQKTLLSAITAALAMGAAVCGMHYCAMYAASFANCPTPPPGSETGLRTSWLAIGIAGVTFIVLSLGLVMAIIDRHLSVRTAAEAERLRRSEARFRSLVQNAADAIILTDRNGRIGYESPSTKGVLGYDEAALLGRSIFDLVHPNEAGRLSIFFDQVTRLDGEIRSIDLRLRQAQGRWGQVEIVASNLLADGNVNGIVLNIRDIHTRMENIKLEELVQERTRALSAANEKLRAEIGERSNAEFALQQAHDQLEVKVRQRTIELERARNTAIQASQAKSQFLANMSHELRTPLNAIIGFADALTQDICGPLAPRQAEYIQHVIFAGRHLLDLIDDILDLARIESGKIQLDYRDCDLDRFVSELTTAIRPVVEHNGNHLSVDQAKSLGTVRTDIVKLRQTLLNLLGNAAKFTKDGEVSLSVSRIDNDRGHRLQFVVRDTGIGISREELASLFQNFHQANPGIARQFGGTGLGLALSQQICRAMGGDIRADSVPGIGSTFIVELPAITGSVAALPGMSL